VVTQEEIREYISSIPPSPKTLKQVLLDLNNGELAKAAHSAAQDPALKLYLQNIVNKPIYSFKNSISDINQIFSILGLTQAKQIVYNYMISLLAPKNWELFKLTNKSFSDLQDTLSLEWKKILEHKNINDKEIFAAISLLPASIIVCEALFKSKQDNINLLRASNDLDYNTILKRLSGMDLYDLCKEIAIAWEMPTKVYELIIASKGESQDLNEETKMLSQWMHLLFFYQLSQPLCVNAGLNDFIEFNIEYVEEIYEEFQDLMGQE